MGQIYEKPYGVGAAIGAIVVSPADVDRCKDSYALIVRLAL